MCLLHLHENLANEFSHGIISYYCMLLFDLYSSLSGSLSLFCLLLFPNLEVLQIKVKRFVCQLAGRCNVNVMNNCQSHCQWNIHKTNTSGLSHSIWP